MMCRCLKVSRSGCYAWLGREPSRTVRRRKELSALIEWVLNSSRGTYGYRRTHAALARRGVETSPDTVRTRHALPGPARPHSHAERSAPPSRPRTWARAPTWSGGTPAANRPGVKWVGDITYIRTWEGFVYLATVPGLLHEESSRVRDWGDNMRTDSVMRGDRYGGPQVPVHKRRDGIPLGPGVPVHLRAALPASGEI